MSEDNYWKGFVAFIGCLFLILWIIRPKKDKFSRVAGTSDEPDNEDELLDNLRLECVRTGRMITLQDGVLTGSQGRKEIDPRVEKEETIERALHKLSSAIRLGRPVQLTVEEARVVKSNIDSILRH